MYISDTGSESRFDMELWEARATWSSLLRWRLDSCLGGVAVWRAIFRLGWTNGDTNTIRRWATRAIDVIRQAS